MRPLTWWESLRMKWWRIRNSVGQCQSELKIGDGHWVYCQKFRWHFGKHTDYNNRTW